jgi:hypothetical protein
MTIVARSAIRWRATVARGRMHRREPAKQPAKLSNCHDLPTLPAGPTFFLQI